MFPYIKKYLHFAVAAVLFMVLEVAMDLLQPSLMSRIVDEGVLGLATQNTGDFSIIIKLGSMMVLFAFVGCLGGSLNNILVNYSSQRMSAGFSSTSNSPASGNTATEAADVWMRPWVSVCGTRWTRWTPDSYFMMP